MSMTESVGVFETSHWSYMAAMMAKSLGIIIEKRKIEPGDIPAGIMVDAKEFFRLVAQTILVASPENPPASMRAYVIASLTVHAHSPLCHYTVTKAELEKLLLRFGDFVECLEKPADLKETEVETAKELQQFFLQLHQRGEAEDLYKRRMD